VPRTTKAKPKAKTRKKTPRAAAKVTFLPDRVTDAQLGFAVAAHFAPKLIKMMCVSCETIVEFRGHVIPEVLCAHCVLPMVRHYVGDSDSEDKK